MSNASADVARIREQVEHIAALLNHKIYAIVNYDNFTIFPDVLDMYSDTVKYLMGRFYSRVTRYTTSSFLRAKLGGVLAQRSVAPHIYENAEDAHAHLRDREEM